ncbi:MAG: 30S ribosome-binding factor RbfA [Armatimonadetes bacterium]|nr:30S ribosome-binding factor RbfA [Armatimonadota bacterium]
MSIRQQRVQRELIAHISEMLHRDLNDPRLSLVTITGANVSADLHVATVYFCTLGNDEQQRNASLKALQSVAGWIGGKFARQAHLRIAPEIHFRYDEGIEKGGRVLDLLRQIEPELHRDEEGDSRSGSGDP